MKHSNMGSLDFINVPEEKESQGDPAISSIDLFRLHERTILSTKALSKLETTAGVCSITD